MKWQIDPSHSEVQFTVRHMMISNVKGWFEKFDGTVDFDPDDVEQTRAHFEIDARSINTREEKRDAHLRSADFLQSEEHPKITFDSTEVERVDDEHFKLHGDLTIRGTSHPAVLDVEYQGIATSPWGTTSAGFNAHTTINRKDWGLTWNQTLETGGMLVGEKVKIDIELELVREEEEELVSETSEQSGGGSRR